MRLCTKDRQALLLGGPNADRIVYSYNEIVIKRAKEGSYKGRGVHEDHFSWTERVGRETPASVGDLRLPRRVSWVGDGFSHPHMDVADTPLIDRAIMDTALRVLEEESPDLFFVGLVSTNIVAHEYQPSSPENRDSILEVDRQIGRLMRWLEERGWLDETLVVVASDHGVTERPLAIDVTTHLKQAGAGDVVGNVLYFMAGSTGGLYLADTSPETVRRTLAAVRAVPHMKGAWHRDDPEAPWFVRRFAHPRSPDILMIPERAYCIVDEGWQRPSFARGVPQGSAANGWPFTRYDRITEQRQLFRALLTRLGPAK